MGVGRQPRPKPAKPPAIQFSEANGLRHLHVGGKAIQSAMKIDAPNELALAYTRAMLGALLFNPQPRDVLLIGLGGGSLAKHIYHRLRHTRIVALEVDVRVVAAAHRWFKLPLGKRRLKVIVGDGANFVANHPRCADLIMLDAFVNHRQAPSIRTRAFYDAAKAALKKDGVLVVNFMTDDPGLFAYLRRLGQTFNGRIACLRAIGEDNVIVFAFRDDPGVITSASLTGRAIALQREHRVEFREFAARLRSPTAIRAGGRPLIARAELRSFKSSVR